MPVLYGVFLYMGVASLNGVQVSYRHYSVLLKTELKKSLLNEISGTQNYISNWNLRKWN